MSIMLSAPTAGQPHPFLPRTMSPLVAHAVNRLARRRKGYDFTLGETPLSFVITGCGLGEDEPVSGETLAWSFGSTEVALTAPAWVWDEIAGEVQPGVGPLDEELRALLAHLALTPLLDHLEPHLGRNATVLAGRARRAPWTVSFSGTLAGRTFDGHVAVEDAGLDWLAEVIGRLPSDPQLPPTLPLRAVVRLGATRLPHRVLADLEPGDVILLDQAAPGERADPPVLVIEIGHTLAALARLEGSLATLTSRPMPASSLHLGTFALDDPSHHASAGEADIGDVRIELVFELGRHTITLGELSSLAPGYVFPLGGAGGTGAMVDIVTAGRTIGRGEIVQVGTAIGVRSTRLFGRE